MTPKQAAAFLAKENKFLTEACNKGLKDGFEPLIEWYQLVYSSSRHLSHLISEEIEESPNALSLVMNTLKCGITSKSDAIMEWTVKLLSKMAFDFSSLNLQTQAWEWFTEGDPSFLNLVFELFQKDTDLFSQI